MGLVDEMAEDVADRSGSDSESIFDSFGQDIYDDPEEDELDFIRRLVALPDFKYGEGCVPLRFVRKYCREHDSIGKLNADTINEDLGYEKAEIEVDGESVTVLADPSVFDPSTA